MLLSVALQLCGAGSGPSVLGLSLLGWVCCLLLFLFAVTLPGQRGPGASDNPGQFWGTAVSRETPNCCSHSLGRAFVLGVFVVPLPFKCN